MTATPDPVEFDTALAQLHADIAKATSVLSRCMDDVFRAAGARKHRRTGWDASYDAAHVKVRETHPELLAKVHEARAAWRTIENQIQAMDRAYTGWSRFFPSVTKSHPHIHRSLTCHTLHRDTQMSWATQLSGKTDAEAVAELDEALCSVCFPSAPVALHNYVSRRSQAEQDARQAEKDARDAAKAAKTLTDAEQFRTGGRYGERITTVAACKDLIRKAVELAVELDWYTSPQADKQLTDWSPEQRAQRERNGRVSLEEARKDAAEARRVLLVREAEHPGWGATPTDIDRMRANKDKAARKEWGITGGTAS